MFKTKDYGFPVFRFLNAHQVMLFVSHGVKPIDNYVSIDKKGEYSLVYVFERDKAELLLEDFRQRKLGIGEYVVRYNG